MWLFNRCNHQFIEQVDNGACETKYKYTCSKCLKVKYKVKETHNYGSWREFATRGCYIVHIRKCDSCGYADYEKKCLF